MAGELRLALILSAVMKGAKAFNEAEGGLQGIKKTLGSLKVEIAAFAALAAFDFLRDSLKVFGEYSDQMQAVQAATGATGEQFQQMDDLARELGATMGAFTATEAAEGMKILAFAGFEVNEILEATPAVLKLAGAGSVALAQAADIAASAVRAYKFDSSELIDVVDVMVKTFTSANTTVEEIGQAFKFVAPVAAAAGVQFEELNAAIAILGNAGIKSTMAGTALRNIILRLQAPSNEAMKSIQNLGLELFELDSIAQNTQKILRDQSQELKNLTLDYDLATAASQRFALDQSKLALQQRKNSLEISKIRKEASDQNRKLTDEELNNIEQIEEANTGLRISMEELGIEQDTLNIKRKEQKNQMDVLQESIKEGNETFNSQKGELRSLADIVDEFKTSFEDLSVAQEAQALKTIVGTRSFSGMQVLIGSSIGTFKEGGDSIRGFTKELENSGGTATEVFGIMEQGAGVQMKLLNAAIDDIKLNFGEALIPVIKSLIPVIQSLAPLLEGGLIPIFAEVVTVIADIILVLKPLIDFLAENTDVVRLLVTAWIAYKVAMGIVGLISALSVAMGIMTGATVTQAGATGGATVAQWGLNAAMLANPIGLIILLIVGLILMFWLLIENWDQVADGFEAAGKAIWDGLMMLGKAFIDFGEIIFNLFSGLWDGIQGIGEFFGDLGQAALDGLEGIAVAFKEFVDNAAQWGLDLIKEFLNGVMDGIASIGDVMGDVENEIASFIGFDVPANDRMVQIWGSDMISFFAKGISNAIPDLANAISGVQMEVEGVVPNATGTTPVAIDPLSLGGGGGGTVITTNDEINITLQIDKIDEGTNMDKVLENMGTAVKRQKQTMGSPTIGITG